MNTQRAVRYATDLVRLSYFQNTFSTSNRSILHIDTVLLIGKRRCKMLLIVSNGLECEVGLSVFEKRSGPNTMM